MRIFFAALIAILGANLLINLLMGVQSAKHVLVEKISSLQPPEADLYVCL